MTSLKTVLALKPTTLYPAHGPHITGDRCVEHLEGYISHRQEREDQVVAVFHRLRSPSALVDDIKSLLEEYDAKKATDWKSQKEYHSGKPYVPKEPTEKESVAQEEKMKARTGRLDLLASKVGQADGLVSLSMLTRVVYRTGDERVIWAAKKSLRAHLDKLYKEGKVRMGKVESWPKVVEQEMVDGDAEEEAWAWIGD